MSRQERQQYQRNQEKEKLFRKNSDNSTFLILIILVVLFSVSRHFISKTVGEDYSLYVTIIPTFLGLASLGIYKRIYLREKLKETDKFFVKIILIVFYSVAGILFSYLSIGLITNVLWSIANNSVAKNIRQEFYNCTITGLLSPTSRSGPSVFYKFNDHTELTSISYEEYNVLRKGDLKKHAINLTVRKGIGDCYVLDNLEIY